MHKLKFIVINIIVAISWPPPLISQHFHSRLLKATPFLYRLALEQQRELLVREAMYGAVTVRGTCMAVKQV